MPHISAPCSQDRRLVRHITTGSQCLLAVLFSLCVASVSEAAHDPRQMMDSIEFFQDDTLEATIDIVTALGYRPRQGLPISFAEVSLGILCQCQITTGDSSSGYTVHLNIDDVSIPYESIAQAIEALIDELSSATVRTMVAGSEYEPLLQDVPPTTVFFTQAVVPEPSSVVILAIFCGMLGAGRRRILLKIL